MEPKYTLDHVLLQRFADHGVSLKPDGGWLTTNHTYPKIRATILDLRPGGSRVSASVHVEVAINNEQTIEEWFSDSGETDTDALNNFMQNFSTSLFHVLLSALWHVHQYDDQVEKETMMCGLKPFDVYFSLICRKSATGMGAPVPEELFQTFEEALRKTNLDDRTHWISFYYGQTEKIPYGPDDSQMASTVKKIGDYAKAEIMLDNTDWPAGEILYQQVAWPRLDFFYSARFFVVLLPQREPTGSPDKPRPISFIHRALRSLRSFGSRAG